MKKNGKRILNVTVVRMPDTDPDTSYLEQEGFEDRLERYRNDEFSFIGIRAEAEIQVEEHGTIQNVTSGGLWGIETDSDESYFDEVADEELADLKGTLSAMGFSKRAIATAYKTVAHKERG